MSGSNSLIHVAVHEIGHALVLRHSNVKGTVMRPTASRGTPKLHRDDIAGIRSLYGMWHVMHLLRCSLTIKIVRKVLFIALRLGQIVELYA